MKSSSPAALAVAEGAADTPVAAIATAASTVADRFGILMRNPFSDGRPGPIGPGADHHCRVNPGPVEYRMLRVDFGRAGSAVQGGD
ncbi:hypothetical protein GCM10009565_67450 [Amycolatopsis albidoflavus]